MQIRNDYTAYSNQNFEHNHTHNITECMHEEMPEKCVGASGKGVSDTVSYQQQRRDSLELFSTVTQETLHQNAKKNKMSFKGFWDSLGEDGTQRNFKKIPLSVKEAVVSQLQGMIHSAGAALHNMMQHKFIRSLTRVPATIKMELSAALKRFKGGESFAALTDGRMPSKQNASKERQKGQVTTKRREEEIKAKELTNSHLMDSYSKKGTYCKINENLTYQKEKVIRPIKKMEVQETEINE